MNRQDAKDAKNHELSDDFRLGDLGIMAVRLIVSEVLTEFQNYRGRKVSSKDIGASEREYGDRIFCSRRNGPRL